jgi:hypothetical protein
MQKLLVGACIGFWWVDMYRYILVGTDFWWVDMYRYILVGTDYW